MRRSFELTHFALEDWVDLARESLPVERKTAMLRHAADCCRCVRTLRVWRRVAAIGRVEASYVPPGQAVRAVKSAYLRRLHQLSPAPTSLVARLVFDSFRAPAAAGVRTLDLCSRQLLFEASDLAIDLRIETASGSPRSSLIGQLLHHAEPAEGSPGRGELPVALLLGKHAVAHTTTNPFGEFLFELELTRRHRIRIQLDAIRSIVVPLGCLDDSESAP